MAWESASLRVCFRLPTGLSCFSRSTSVSRPQVPLAHGPRHRQPHVATTLLPHPPALPVILRAQLNITFSRSFHSPRSGLPASHDCLYFSSRGLSARLALPLLTAPPRRQVTEGLRPPLWSPVRIPAQRDPRPHGHVPSNNVPTGGAQTLRGSGLWM